jgi:hypothetical protein
MLLTFVSDFGNLTAAVTKVLMVELVAPPETIAISLSLFHQLA